MPKAATNLGLKRAGQKPNTTEIRALETSGILCAQSQSAKSQHTQKYRKLPTYYPNRAAHAWKFAACLTPGESEFRHSLARTINLTKPRSDNRTPEICR
jgi:hypothetical protein